MMIVGRSLKRLLARVIRWATTPERIPYAVRGMDVWIVEPFAVNHPERVFLGSNVYIGPHAALNSQGGIRIGDGCVFGPFVHVYSANHRYEDADKIPFDEQFVCKPVDIRAYVWIGGDVVILPGVTIGEGAVIGAGSVVAQDIPPGAIAAGSPARPLKRRNLERFEALKAAGRVFRVRDAHTLSKQGVAKIPAEWYLDAGLPVPTDGRVGS